MKKSNCIKLKDNFVFCYHILEDSKSSIVKKVSQIDKERKCMMELRLDYLLCAGMPIEDTIKLVNNIK